MFLHVLHKRKVANSWLLFVPGVCTKRGEKVRNSRSENDRPAKFQVGKFILSALGFFAPLLIYVEDRLKNWTEIKCVSRNTIS